jgi:glycerol-3-phosphate acyltransferase PlsY
VFVLSYIAVAIVAYLLGSIPTGFLVAKARGVDIRAVGSGNIGAANTFRAVGKVAGIFVLLMDALKGVAAVLVCFPILTTILAGSISKGVKASQPPEEPIWRWHRSQCFLPCWPL